MFVTRRTDSFSLTRFRGRLSNAYNSVDLATFSVFSGLVKLSISFQSDLIISVHTVLI